MEQNITDELRRRFSVTGVTIDPGAKGLPCVNVRSDLAEARIYLNGAHITTYKPRGGTDLLFLSGKSHFQPGKPIRGGVPVIFPWFGPKADDPSAPQHGFARTTQWDLEEVSAAPAGAIRVTLAMRSSDATRKLWPQDFELRFSVNIGSTLEMSLQVTNTSTAAFSFEEALHTYLAVSDVRQVAVEGLAGRDFLDKTEGYKRKTQPPGALRIEGETDRVYLQTSDTVTVKDPAFKAPLVVAKENSNNTVVWNPWIDKAKAMADFGDDEWPRMLCVETANVGESRIQLAPGQSHVMTCTVSR